ncbi:uncharacterized protein [Narcine bancroftii]|uniref:uncharacterized protein isoform X1 n=1 Tax=Narcine bancroftii TaxID=1343680 RepID=UPI0038322393
MARSLPPPLGSRTLAPSSPRARARARRLAAPPPGPLCARAPPARGAHAAARPPSCPGENGRRLLTMSLRIYFCGSIRGGRQDALIYSRIIQHLQRFGRVLTEHVGHPDLAGEGGLEVDDKYIHDRDLQWLQEADVIVAEVTQPSLGVGYEIGRAASMNKKILCLFQKPSKYVMTLHSSTPQTPPSQTPLTILWARCCMGDPDTLPLLLLCMRFNTRTQAYTHSCASYRVHHLQQPTLLPTKASTLPQQ